MIRELKDENCHLRDETANLRKSLKSKQFEMNQVEFLKIYFALETKRTRFF